MKRSKAPGPGSRPLFAALDLGSNNCRLLIATPRRDGFRVVDSFSRIVRLGEGVAQTGRLSEASMSRTLDALKVCAEKITARKVLSSRCIATQACRGAENGEAFLKRVQEETGISLEIVSPEIEALLSVHGSHDLMDRHADAAIIFDIGGGSTEISWVSLSGTGRGPRTVETAAWTSLPIGVVSLAETLNKEEFSDHDFNQARDEIASRLRDIDVPEPIKTACRAGRAHLVGTSGTVTSLAGVHLQLPRYDRSKVDGLWLTAAEVQSVTARLRAMGHQGRAEEPCIGAERADLVVPGCAILSGLLEAWPCDRIRVGDRGLREGMLIQQIAEWRGAR